MQNAGDYYQRAPRCCPGRSNNNNNNSAVRGAELLCCCCSCSTATSTKTPGLLASLGVCVLVLGYTLLGAFAFMALEGGLKSVSDRKNERSTTIKPPHLRSSASDPSTLAELANFAQRLTHPTTNC